MPDISKIQLPSGGIYDIKDTVARDMISAGVSFIVAWDGSSAPVAANIPAGVAVTYNSTTTTGTLAVTAATPGAFYLVRSKTLPASETFDGYDEYVVIKPDTTDDTTWYWEKIGDTKLDLSDVVTNVSLNKDTTQVIGPNSTLSATQPNVSLTTSTSASTGAAEIYAGFTTTDTTVSVVKSLGTPTTTKVLGTSATLTNTQPTITITGSSSSGDGAYSVVTGVAASNTNVKATASGANTAWKSKDAVNAVTGYANPNMDTFVKTVSTTSKKLKTTSITGVSGSTTASKATAATAKTAATGSGTASTNNTDWLKNVSVSNEVLVIGAATMDTESIPQYTFSNVTVPTAATATTVATGAVADSDTAGATIVTDTSVGTSAQAITGLGTATTKSVIGASSTFTVTQPTIALATNATAGTGTVSLTYGVGTTDEYLKATASGGGAAFDSTDEQTVVTGYNNAESGLAIRSITYTPKSKFLSATASTPTISWNQKDLTSVLAPGTDVVVTKGQE